MNKCYHCGDDVIGKGVHLEDKVFCCSGCRSVYQLLSDSDLGSFYEIETNAGIRPNDGNEHKYTFLDADAIRKKFIEFEDDKNIHITLFLPSIHCSSCIYLLENIQKLDDRIVSCQVNFTKRQAAMVISKEFPLSELALLLDKIGYAPNFGDRKKSEKKRNVSYLYKLGVAGFAFGSIMLWSVPEYLGVEQDNPEFRNFTAYLSFAVSIPVLVYSAREYLNSAYKALRYRSLNLDVPISIGILALYLQSAYNIFAGLGPGYMDSFAGFIFFLLIGKWFQNKTYSSLSFERDYTSYFPVAVTRIRNNEEEIVEIDQLGIEDELIIRNQEVIPCDSVLLSEEARVDYSFVTGESNPVKKVQGDFIYAGGKLLGQQSKFAVVKESSRSHLTQLWNDANPDKKKEETADKLSIYFLIGVLIIAAISAVIWGILAPHRITEIVVSVLIVACPCALALSGPFTYGNIMRLLGLKGLYLKNTEVIKTVNETTDIVFDKTGTLTTGSSDRVHYVGTDLNKEQKAAILVLANSSTHPVARSLVTFLKSEIGNTQAEIKSFEEVSGRGISGTIDNDTLVLGSSKFVEGAPNSNTSETASHIAINGKYFGKFVFESAFRPGIEELLKTLTKKHTVHILSGDSDKDRTFLNQHAPEVKNIYFQQSPEDKLNYIKALQNEGKHVLMIGDGLNDAGALQQSDAGIAISEDIFRFSPSSDAIIEAKRLVQLDRLLDTSRFSSTVLLICYIFSILYNVIGLTFAVSGNLTPLVAAILMPISSISIVLISTFIVRFKK